MDILKLIGGTFLLWLAYKEAIKKNENNKIQLNFKGNIKLIIEVFFLTMTNPVTILSFIGVFSSISIVSTSIFESVLMIIGIFIGSISWWYLLGSIILKIRERLPQDYFNKIKWVSCFILGSFGSISIFSVLFTRI